MLKKWKDANEVVFGRSPIRFRESAGSAGNFSNVCVDDNDNDDADSTNEALLLSA